MSGDTEKKMRKKARDKKAALAIIIIAVVIVLVTLLLTVWLVPEFDSLADLFSYIRTQI